MVNKKSKGVYMVIFPRYIVGSSRSLRLKKSYGLFVSRATLENGLNSCKVVFSYSFLLVKRVPKHQQGGSCFQYQQGTSTGPETTSNRKPALKKCKYTIFTDFFMGTVYSCRLVSVQKVLVSVDETL
jgi:hypothetical protein